MIELFMFAPVNGTNPSPYCAKVETYCQLAGVEYKPRTIMPYKAPRGKLPYIVDNGQLIPDSDRIIEHLKKTRGDPLDAELTDGQKAIGHLLKQTVEQSLYFVAIYSRWVDEDNWPAIREMFFGKMPAGVKQIVPVIARRGVTKSLHGQGYGRNPGSEIYQTGADDLKAIAWQLGQQGFAVADKPASVDAAVFGLLNAIVNSPVKSPLQQSAATHPEIGEYVARMAEHLAALRAG